MRISRITLPTHRPAAMLRFYSALGFTVNAMSQPAQVLIGDSVVSVVDSGGVSSAGQHLAFHVAPTRFDAAVDWITGLLPVLSGPDGAVKERPGPWRARSIYFRAPDGMNCELIARNTSRPQSSYDFDGREIGGVAEMSIAVSGVRATVALLYAQLNLSCFELDGNDFAAVGDARGLLVIAREGRPWWPTEDQYAASGPVSIAIEGAPSWGTVNVGGTLLTTMARHASARPSEQIAAAQANNTLRRANNLYG